MYVLLLLYSIVLRDSAKSCTKAAKQIEMQFGMVSRVDCWSREQSIRSGST